MIYPFTLMLLIGIVFSVSATEQHDDHKEAHNESNEHKHSDEHKHGEESHEEESANVGPEKGIIEVNEQKGFRLSPEALNNFELKMSKLNGDGPWPLSRSALVHSGEEVNLFRLRNGFFKRIDFQIIRKTENEVTVDSDDMREGDEIILSGLGFLRIAELAATGGVAHGHSH